MLESHFFIPARREDFLKEIPSIIADHFLIEDEFIFEEVFINEFDLGCKYKFIIHPRQIQEKKTEYFSLSEIAWAKKALKQIEGKSLDEIKAYKIDGMGLEKPYLTKLKKIKQYLEEK